VVRNSLETAAAGEKGQSKIEAWRTPRVRAGRGGRRTIRGENQCLVRAAITELATGVPYMGDKDRLEIQNLYYHATSA
jgi:hypothetical protein